MWPDPARAAKRGEVQSLSLAALFVLVFFSLNASCEQSSTVDQGVKQAFQRYHECLGRKVSKAVERPSKPLPPVSRQATVSGGESVGPRRKSVGQPRRALSEKICMRRSP